MNQYFIYTARLLSACCFYLFLAKANIWLDTTDNTILAFGYRFFLILAPLVFLITNKWITLIAFSISTGGIVFWLSDNLFIGTILLSLGMAIGGYVLKYHASKTPIGVSNNRIALNMGVFFSGLIILLPINNKSFMLLGLAFMVITLLCSMYIREKTQEDHKIQKLNFSFSQLLSIRGLAWAIVGFVMGIKLMSIMSILPQYLIYELGKLPWWYGLVISLSSIVIVFLQIPIIHVMKRFNFFQTFILLAISMVFIAFPNLFYCETIIGGLIWTFSLTVLECGISYLDIFSAKEGTLLIKEFFIGIGMASTVFLMRNVDPASAAFMLGLIGLIGTLLAVKLLKPQIILQEKVAIS